MAADGPAGGSSGASNANRQRPRVTRACDRCKMRKMRCTGKKPCANCVKASASCEYNAKYTRGVAPPIERAPEATLSAEGGLQVNKERESRATSSYSNRSSSRSSSEQLSENRDLGANQNQSETREHQAPNNSYSYPENHDMFIRSTAWQRESRRTFVSEQALRETIRRESLDPGSAARVFERTEKTLQKRVPQHKNSSIFAFGDPPLPEVDRTFFTLPPPEVARAMVAKYFEFAAPINRFLHQPTVEKWLDETLDSFRAADIGTEQNSARAVVLMVLASSHGYMEFNSEDENNHLSLRYFQTAEQQLKTETGEPRLPTVQARLLQCFYLNGRSRVNQSWTIFGTVVNLVLAMGLHRKHRISGEADLIDVECSKRAFWAAYLLDKYLGSAMGRPLMFHNDDFDQELPNLVDDENLTSKNMLITKDPYQCAMMGSILQNKITLIMGKIMKKIYKIKPQPLEVRLMNTQKIKEDFALWRKEAAAFVDFDPLYLVKPLFRRQSFALTLSDGHARILLYRPFLLENVNSGTTRPDFREKIEEYVNDCLAAAMTITDIVDKMYQMEKAFNASWFAHFCAYNAVVALYVYVIKQQSEPSKKWMPYFEAGARCQNQIKISAEKESFAQKCSVVLEELRFEAVGHMQKKRKQPTAHVHEVEPRQEVHQRHENLQQGRDQDMNQIPQEQNNLPPPPFFTQTQQHVEYQTNVSIGMSQPHLPNIPGFQDSTVAGSYFHGDWDDMNFDQGAPGGGILGSLFQGLDGVRVRDPSDSMLDQIDRWGFPSLTGYGY